MQLTVSRRDLLTGSLAAAAIAFARQPLLFGFADPAAGEELIPFLDEQPVNPERPMVQWDQLKDFVTPNEQFFSVSHYGTPSVTPSDWRLDIAGMVERPRSWSLDELKALPKQEYLATLECSGNGASPKFMGAIGNARWSGTPLAPLLEQCGLTAHATEIVFYGADQGTEKIREQEYPQNFGRSLSRENALKDDVLLAYEMNGEPLAVGHGQPVRLIVPGWYGIAWVKWLNRIEAVDRRFMGRFMARDYVTIRGEQQGDRTIWRETSVGPMNVKSLVGRVTRQADGGIQVNGAAWTDGTPLKSVELSIDGGDWLPAELHQDEQAEHAWTFWSVPWPDAQPGEHTLVSRATDAAGRVQPAADDPAIALKKTYWEANQQYPRRIKI